MLPVVGDLEQLWIYPAVEALTAITTSAAPLEAKLRSACTTMMEEADVAAVWVISTATDPISLLCVESNDQEATTLIRSSDQRGHLAVQSGMKTMTLRSHLRHSPIIDRSFLMGGLRCVVVCCPLISHGRAIGSFVCLFRKEQARTDLELSHLRICARILAMAISSSAEFDAQLQEAQWSRRFAALASTLPGTSLILSSLAETSTVMKGQECVPGLDDLRKHFDGSHAARDANSSGVEHTKRQQEAFRSAMDGVPSKCHVNHHGPNGVRIVEHRFAPVADHRGVTSEVAMFARDVTDFAKMKQSLRELTERDSVTGSLTMGALIDRARAHIEAGGCPGKQTVFMSIEVDGSGTGVHFLGNDVFEELIQSIMGRISKCFPGEDAIARRGERNFVAMLDVTDGKKFASEVSSRLVNELREPLVNGRKEHAMSVTVGYSIYPDDGKSADEMFRCADIAASSAQRSGRNCALPFKLEMAQEADERSRLEARLYRAVENEEFTLAFQPKIQLSDGSVSGVEALLRWSGKNAISPARFIPIAEECGLISYIGEWVLRQACKTAKRWSDSGIRIPISVNVSTRQFHDNDFHNIVREILDECECDPSLIDLEVTEGVMFTDPSAAILSFSLLKEMGVSISIDDFGMGFSSLSYLKSLPADSVKIDRAFIGGLPKDKDNAAIAMAIIAMAKAMNMRVVAEGVEERECLVYLRSLGCDEVQGFYFSKALPEDAFLSWYDAYRRLAA